MLKRSVVYIKNVLIFISMLLVSMLLFSSCSNEGEELSIENEVGVKGMEHNQNTDNDTNKVSEQISENIKTPKKDIERIFINLNYLGNIDDKVYLTRHMNLEIEISDEITWWNHYTIDQYSSSLNYYGFILPNGVDYEKHDIILSFGRRLKYLYYYEKDNGCTPEDEGYRARPVFERDFVQNSVYVYLIDKIDLCDSELASEDMGKFMDGKIPFELPEIEDEINEPKRIYYGLAGGSVYGPAAFYDEWGFKIDSPITL